MMATPYQLKYLPVHHLSIYWVPLASKIDKITCLSIKEPYNRDNILQKRPIT